MERRKRASVSEHVYQEAGEWFLEFRAGEPDVETRRDFDEWIRRSPDHLGAYLEMAAIWNEAPALEAADAQGLIERAVQDLKNENVVRLSGRRESVEPGVRATLLAGGLSRPVFRKAAVVFVAVIAGAVWLWLANDSVYSTGIGEQRTIALNDGSTMELNSRSKVKVHYSSKQRGIELIAGQALFSVAKDPTRRFVVSSANARVQAIGTRFDVYRKGAGTIVTVIEGRVAIRDDGRGSAESNPIGASGGNDDGGGSASASDGDTGISGDRGRGVIRSGSSVLISAGQQLVVTQSEMHKPVPANISNVTAWTQHELAFDGVALSDVVEEFNRYNKRQLVIRDAAISSFRVSGVFSSTNPSGLIRFLRDQRGVRVTESRTEIDVGTP